MSMETLKNFIQLEKIFFIFGSIYRDECLDVGERVVFLMTKLNCKIEHAKHGTTNRSHKAYFVDGNYENMH